MTQPLCEMLGLRFYMSVPTHSISAVTTTTITEITSSAGHPEWEKKRFRALSKAVMSLSTSYESAR
eukprot:CAMPEP_0171968378 /NCGR_PEP_ID=MMETSP0993-20121228/202928_1 /TAXON_ID=483369 /ORGANISM="non described non described, Strain CCMP2098" /LENGTH=65 /DNA_ID=CAMNT_0012618079 /DNA_START=69 /DNA_END=263 /DNA_ORIENTATION=-